MVTEINTQKTPWTKNYPPPRQKKSHAEFPSLKISRRHYMIQHVKKNLRNRMIVFVYSSDHGNTTNLQIVLSFQNTAYLNITNQKLLPK